MCGAAGGMVGQGVGTVTGMVSSGGQAYASLQNEKYLEKVEKQKAKISLANAASANESGQMSTANEAATRQQAIHAGKATFAANGVQVDGAPTDASTMWKEDQNTQLGRDLEVIMRNAQSESWNYSNEAKQHKAAQYNHGQNIKNINKRAYVTIATAM